MDSVVETPIFGKLLSRKISLWGVRDWDYISNLGSLEEDSPLMLFRMLLKLFLHIREGRIDGFRIIIEKLWRSWCKLTVEISKLS